MILQTRTVLDQRVCHGLVSRQGQCHSALEAEIYFRAITFHWFPDLDDKSHNCCLQPKGVPWP